MKSTLIALLTSCVSLVASAQQARILTLNDRQYEVVTKQVPGCFGPSQPYDELYQVVDGVRHKIDLGIRCMGCTVKISRLTDDPDGQVVKLIVEHTLGESTFYLIEGAWVRKT